MVDNTDKIFGRDNATKVEMLGCTILVRRNEAKSMVGSIYMPDAAKDRLDIGPVVASGPDSVFKVGAVVEWKSHAGSDGLETFDQFHMVLDDDDVLMVHHFDECWCGGKDGKHVSGTKNGEDPFTA